jgi:hypothetical protein
MHSDCNCRCFGSHRCNAAARSFSLHASDLGLFRSAAAILALDVADNGMRSSIRSRARCRASSDQLWPRLAALIFALVLGDNGPRLRFDAAILARVSGVSRVPSFNARNLVFSTSEL